MAGWRSSLVLPTVALLGFSRVRASRFPVKVHLVVALFTASQQAWAERPASDSGKSVDADVDQSRNATSTRKLARSVDKKLVKPPEIGSSRGTQKHVHRTSKGASRRFQEVDHNISMEDILHPGRFEMMSQIRQPTKKAPLTVLAKDLSRRLHGSKPSGMVAHPSQRGLLTARSGQVAVHRYGTPSRDFPDVPLDYRPWIQAVSSEEAVIDTGSEGLPIVDTIMGNETQVGSAKNFEQALDKYVQDLQALEKAIKKTDEDEYLRHKLELDEVDNKIEQSKTEMEDQHPTSSPDGG